MPRSPRFLLLLLASLVTALSASAATFVVDSSGSAPDFDSGDGVCDDGSGACTLRAAIDQANASPGPDRIEFAIPGAGPHTISDSDLFVTDALTLDATTQPGASVNTLAVGTNAVLPVVLEGDFGTGSGVGLYAFARVTLRGLAIRGAGGGIGTCLRFDSASAGSRVLGSLVERCGSEAVVVQADNVQIGGPLPASRNRISDSFSGISLRGIGGFVVNNLIGTDASGAASAPNRYGLDIAGSQNSVTDNWIDAVDFGVNLQLSSGNTLARNRIRGDGSGVGIAVVAGGAHRIGLPSATLEHANRISNWAVGVDLSAGTSGNLVQGNLIGVESDGSPSASSFYGVLLRDSSSGNTIGEPLAGTPGAGNWIAFNQRGLVLRSGSDNSLRANRIWSQTSFNVELGENASLDDDETPFPPDQDAGANHLQNPPRVGSVTRTGGETRIEGAIAAAAGSYALDFYSNLDCPFPPGSGPSGGQFHLGEAALIAAPSPADPLTPFDVILPVVALGNGFTATATDAGGNTSEFGECFSSTLAQADLSVEVTADRSVALPGEDVVFTVSLANAGPLEASGVVVQVPRPDGFSSWDADSAGSYSEATGEWQAGNVASGAVATLLLTGRVAPDALGTLELLAVAGQGASEVDPDLTDNEDAAQVEVATGADLTVTQTGPFAAPPGAAIEIRVAVSNRGPANALGVTLTGHLEEGLVWDGHFAPPNLSFDPPTRRWTLDAVDLGPGASAGIAIRANVDAAASFGTGLRHTASARAASPPDPSPELSTLVVAVGAAADLVTSIFDATSEDPQAVRVEISNRGPYSIDGFHMELYGSIEPLTEPAAVCEYDAGGASCEIERVLAPHTSFNFEIEALDHLTVVVSAAASHPYYEVDAANNSKVLLRQTACGLTGLEAALGIGVMAWVRRRLGSRSRRRGLPAALLLMAAVGGAPRSAGALPVALTVDGGDSGATVSLASPLGSPPPVPTALSGSAAADVSFAVDPTFGLVATGLQLTGVALDFSDVSIPLASPPLFSLSFASSGVGASLGGPLAPGFAVGPGLSLFDLGGSVLTFDQGTIAASGTYFGLPVNAGFDFATLPYGSVFPINTVAQVLVSDLGGGNAGVRITLPFSVPLNLVVDDLESTVTVAGTLVLVGDVVVPEPASGLLLGAGLAGVAGWRRRRHGAR